MKQTFKKISLVAATGTAVACIELVNIMKVQDPELAGATLALTPFMVMAAYTHTEKRLKNKLKKAVRKEKLKATKEARQEMFKELEEIENGREFNWITLDPNKETQKIKLVK